MPTYDYACLDCSRVVEVIHGVHAHGPDRCQWCGGPMKKLLSAPTVHFKGSGWAKKDASRAASGAKTPPKPASGEATADAAPGTPAPPTASESKPPAPTTTSDPA